MNIALMTWFEHHNYGTALQLVALSRYLSKNNTVDVVNYHTRAIQTDFKGGMAAQIIKRFSSFKNPIYDTAGRKKAFEDFLSNNLRFTNKCDILPELESLNDEYDCFVCGSDQIWNPARFDSHYYLDYVFRPDKMIAYAPSLGVSELGNVIIREKIRKLTGRFVHLSVREKVGAEIIAELTDKEVKTVLDPTLLLSRGEWDSIVGEQHGNCCEYALVYMLGDNKEYWKMIEAFKRKSGVQLKIIPVYQKDLRRDGCIGTVVGPEEFVSLVKNAKYVLTDSFHGMVFSIIYEKPFGAFERFANSEGFNQNARVHNLLEITGLGSRLISKRIPLTDIDYSRVKVFLNKEVQSSQAYLSRALESVASISTDTNRKKHIRNQIDLCCGCGACEQVCGKSAITMIRNKKGFFESVVDEGKCVSCGACQRVCPLVHNEKAKSIGGGELYSYKDADTNILRKSSSGGAAYAIGKIGLIEKCDILGCSFNKESQEAEFITVSSEAELHKTQGSKYMQSCFHRALPELTGRKKHFFVFGLPCQIAAARKLHGDNATYIELICHGVPTYNLYRMYQKYVEDKFGIATSAMEIFFRDKSKGWRERYIKVADTKNEVITSQYDDPYFLLFESGLCYSRSCYECPWRDKSLADIRIGDYWGPRYANDKNGVSMVLSLTQRGKQIVNELSAYGSLEKTDISDIFKWQQHANKAEPLLTSQLLDDLSEHYNNYEEINKKYIAPYRKASIRQKEVDRFIYFGKTIIGKARRRTHSGEQV